MHILYFLISNIHPMARRTLQTYVREKVHPDSRQQYVDNTKCRFETPRRFKPTTLGVVENGVANA